MADVAVTHNGVVQASFAAFGSMSPTTAGVVVTGNTGIAEWTQPAGADGPRSKVRALQRHNDTAHLTGHVIAGSADGGPKAHR